MNTNILIIVFGLFIYSFLLDYFDGKGAIEQSQQLVLRTLNNTNIKKGTHTFIWSLKNFKNTTITIFSGALAFILKYLPVRYFFF
jgi:hypothetical protein